MANVPVAPAVARPRSIGGRLNSAAGQLHRSERRVNDRDSARHCSRKCRLAFGSFSQRRLFGLESGVLSVHTMPFLLVKIVRLRSCRGIETRMAKEKKFRDRMGRIVASIS
jgi:hypothetical protein